VFIWREIYTAKRKKKKIATEVPFLEGNIYIVSIAIISSRKSIFVMLQQYKRNMYQMARKN